MNLNTLLIAAITLMTCNERKVVATQSGIELKSPDSLSKYTYFVLGFMPYNNSANSISGSGFFLRHDGKLYFATAKHVLIGCKDGSHERDEHHPDIMNILIEDNSGFPSSSIQINCKTLKDLENCDDPDVIAVEVNDNKNINSVENFIAPNFKRVKYIQIFGFPSLENMKGGFHYSKAYNLHFNGDSVQYSQFVDINTKIKDTFSIYMLGKKIQPGAYGGMSGSPVFFQDYKSGKWRIGGVFTHHNVDTANTFLLGITEFRHLLNRVPN